MAKLTFKFSLAGLNELMKSAEMQSVLDEAARKIAAAAGEGYEVEAAQIPYDYTVEVTNRFK